MERGHEEIALGGQKVTVVGEAVEPFEEQPGDHVDLRLSVLSDGALAPDGRVAAIGADNQPVADPTSLPSTAPLTEGAPPGMTLTSVTPRMTSAPASSAAEANAGQA